MDKITSKTKVVSFALIALGILAVPITLLATKQNTDTRSQAAQQVSEDVNSDGKVDITDVTAIREAIDEQKYVKRADITKDGIIDSKDIEEFYRLYSLR